MDYKTNVIDEEGYTEVFLNHMHERITQQGKLITETLTDAVEDHNGIVLSCYCPAGSFCHRLLLAKTVFPKYAKELGFEFEYLGEIT